MEAARRGAARGDGELTSIGYELAGRGDTRGALERALAIMTKARPDHPHVAQLAEQLAAAQLAAGDREGARAAYRRALADRERLGLDPGPAQRGLAAADAAVP